jgi:hypothetical protein
MFYLAFLLFQLSIIIPALLYHNTSMYLSVVNAFCLFSFKTKSFAAASLLPCFIIA